jgi:hypothetical protein
MSTCRFHHPGLAQGRWRDLPFISQLANVGSEVERTIKWRHEERLSQQAFERALELLDLTIADPKNRGRLRELTRVREALVDYFMFDNDYGSSDALWRSYFYAFSYAARLGL